VTSPVAAARLNPQLAMPRPGLGRKRLVANGKARTQLGWSARPVEQTIADTAAAVIAEDALRGQASRSC
jgi:nucleoside-diphosphate-sugar epimerase